MMHYGYGYGLGGAFGWLAALLLLVLLILGIVLLVREFDGGRRRGSRSMSFDIDQGRGAPLGGAANDPAMHILRERYARGEIDKEEFEQRKRDLA